MSIDSSYRDYVMNQPDYFRNPSHVLSYVIELDPETESPYRHWAMRNLGREISNSALVKRVFEWCAANDASEVMRLYAEAHLETHRLEQEAK